MTRKKIARPYHKPRQRKSQNALQTRPTISFRTHRAILDRLDALADRFKVPRNEVIERTLFFYLSERGDDVAALMAQAQEDHDAQYAFDIFK